MNSLLLPELKYLQVNNFAQRVVRIIHSIANDDDTRCLI